MSPSPEQIGKMSAVRAASAAYCKVLESYVPDGPDKTYLLRKLWEVAIWANIAITRNPDGSPKT